MSLLRKYMLDGLAIAGTCFWDSPASEMGVVSPGDGGGDKGGESRSKEPTEEVGDGQDDTNDADEEHSDADASEREGSSDRGDDDDPDDEDDEDEDDETRPPEERLKKVLKAKRRLERKHKKLQPTAARLRELQNAGLNLDDLVMSHRQLATLQRRLEESPKLRKLLEGDDDDEGSTTSRGRKAGEREPVKYPFKTDNESGQFFKKLHEDFNSHTETVNDRLQRLEKALETESGARRTERTTAAVRDWRTAAETAAKQIPEGFRDLFMHTIGNDMRRALRGELNATPQQVIDHHLTKLRKKGAIGKKETSRASDAARESIARRNDNLPRRPAGNGRPGPVKERQIPRMSDFNKGLRQRFGGN